MTRIVEAWSKHQKVERTAPGSKNPYKVTYYDGQEKWTDDYPGDGRGGNRKTRLQNKKQSRPSIKDARAKLDAAVKKYVSGDSELGALSGVVDSEIVHLGREVAKETIAKWLKEKSEGAEGKAKEAYGAIRDRMNDKLRRKKAMSDRVGGITEKVASNEVSETLKAQIRHYLPYLKRAVSKAMGLPMVNSGVNGLASTDGAEFVFKGYRENGEEVWAGAVIRYDAGSDTYTVLPYVIQERIRFWGTITRDFYFDDLGDESKVAFMFKRVVEKLPPLRPVYDEKTAGIVSRIVQAEYPGQERLPGRLERVEGILEDIKRLPGVADAVLNDRTQTGDSVEFYVSLKVRERFSGGWPYESRVKEFAVDLSQVRREVMAVLRKDRDMGIESWNMPKKLYKTTMLNYKRDTYFIGYNQDVIIVNLWVR